MSAGTSPYGISLAYENHPLAGPYPKHRFRYFSFFIFFGCLFRTFRLGLAFRPLDTPPAGPASLAFCHYRLEAGLAGSYFFLRRICGLRFYDRPGPTLELVCLYFRSGRFDWPHVSAKLARQEAQTPGLGVWIDTPAYR